MALCQRHFQCDFVAHFAMRISILRYPSEGWACNRKNRRRNRATLPSSSSSAKFITDPQAINCIYSTLNHIHQASQSPCCSAHIRPNHKTNVLLRKTLNHKSFYSSSYFLRHSLEPIGTFEKITGKPSTLLPLHFT